MDQLEEIKQKLDIVELIGEVVPLKKAGRNFKAPCPFHSETQPSFMVSPERQIFKCFGCGAGGDIFKFTMLNEGLEFGEAVRRLAKKAGVVLKTYKLTGEEQRKRLFFEINHLAAEFYHYLLLNHQSGKKALEYILGRGISRESLETFKIGYSPAMWDGVQRFLIHKKHYRGADLEEAGLIIKNQRGGWYDRFRNRLMFPLQDDQGNICGFAGRVLEKDAKEAKYINSAETPVYHKSQLLYGFFQTRAEIHKADAVVLMEGELDMISSYQAGIKNGVAIKGSALTEGQLHLLKRVTANLVLALDADLAGDAAARRGIELADNQGFNLKVVEVKGGKDPDDAAQSDPAGWRKQVSEAVPIYDYLLDSAFRRFGGKTAEEKKKIGQEVLPMLARISDEIVRSYYVSRLASRLGVGEEAVLKEMGKFPGQKTERVGLPKIDLETDQRGRGEVLEEYLLALCLQTGKWAFLTEPEVAELVETLNLQKIEKGIEEYLKKNQKTDSVALAAGLPAEIGEIFNHFYFFELGDWLGEEEAVEKELARVVRDLKKERMRQKLKGLAEEIKRAEEGKDAEKRKTLKRLNEEFRDLSAKMQEV